ncbi:MAG: hypothetical protein HBSAPP03_12950 [Phycisphaerae bacterium]|nr:MAG: hypothetical protein HBSAPP03_12950 [Phycisphaerae bacterium]
MPSPDVTDAHLRHLATLSRLTLTDAETPGLRESLAAIIAYVDRLRDLDLAGVQPMTRPGDEPAPLADDVPNAAISVDTLRAIAPAMHGDYIAVPKVLGDGGGA